MAFCLGFFFFPFLKEKKKSNFTTGAEEIQSLHEMEAETWSSAGGCEGCAEAEIQRWVRAGRGAMGLARDNCQFSLLLVNRRLCCGSNSCRLVHPCMGWLVNVVVLAR